MLHQSLQFLLLVWLLNVTQPVQQVLLSICDREYAGVPICLFTYQHFHVEPVFPENFPNKIRVSVGFITRLDPQSRYSPACYCTAALPSCGQLKKCIYEGISLLRPEIVLSALGMPSIPKPRCVAETAALHYLHCCWLRDLCLEMLGFLTGSHFR